MTYSEKLRDPRWQKRRLEIMSRDNFSCLRCGDNKRQQHVHHTKYIRGLEPWEYGSNLLETLCSLCHEKEHKKVEVIHIELERKYEHFLIKKEIPIVISSIENQLSDLSKKLQENITDELMEDILRNIMFLQSKRKELKAA